jgi:hypothetical protein
LRRFSIMRMNLVLTIATVVVRLTSDVKARKDLLRDVLIDTERNVDEHEPRLQNEINARLVRHLVKKRPLQHPLQYSLQHPLQEYPSHPR